jgi:hypothetical protein
VSEAESRLMRGPLPLFVQNGSPQGTPLRTYFPTVEFIDLSTYLVVDLKTNPNLSTSPSGMVDLLGCPIGDKRLSTIEAGIPKRVSVIPP